MWLALNKRATLISWISTHNEFWQTTTIKITVNQGVWECVGIWCQISIIQLFQSLTDVIDFLPKCEDFRRQNYQKMIMIFVCTRAEKQPLHLEQTIALHWMGGNKRRRRWRSKTWGGGGSVFSQGGWLHLEELWAAHAIAFLRCTCPIRSSQAH